MADFETTINEAATKLAEIIEQADEAQSALDSLREQVTTASDQIETQWEALNTAAQTLLEKINTAQAELEAEGTEVTERITQFQDQIETLQTELGQELETVQTSLSALDDQTDTLMGDQETAWQAVETALTALQDQTTEAEAALEGTLSQSETFLQDDMIVEVQAQREEIESRSTALESYINEQCLPEITDKTAEFAERIADLLDRLSQKLAETSETTQTSTTDALDQLKQRQTDLIDGLVGTADDLNAEFEQIGGTIDRTTTTAVETFGLMQTGVDTANVGLESAIGVFEEAKEMLSKFM